MHSCFSVLSGCFHDRTRSTETYSQTTAANDARVTQDDDETGRCTPVVMMAVRKHIASVAAQNGGGIDGGEENLGRIAGWLLQFTCGTRKDDSQK